MATFDKPALPHKKLLELMESRGLICPDRNRILRHLKNVSYYRFSEYASSFYQNPKSENPVFRPNTTYEEIWQLYLFDRKLRLLTLDAIERIEVSARSILSDCMSLADDSMPPGTLPYGPHWFMNEEFYHDKKYCPTFCSEIEKETGKNNPDRRIPSISRYYSQYDEPSLPPSWMVMEALSMGKWTLALSKLIGAAQKKVASQYSLPSVLLISWLGSLAWTRNVAAHQGRLWNRHVKRPPRVPKPVGLYCPDFSHNASTYYATACVCFCLLKRIVTKSTWADRLQSLFVEFPSVDKTLMGFPENWKSDSFWKA